MEVVLNQVVHSFGVRGQRVGPATACNALVPKAAHVVMRVYDVRSAGDLRDHTVGLQSASNHAAEPRAEQLFSPRSYLGADMFPHPLGAHFSPPYPALSDCRLRHRPPSHHRAPRCTSEGVELVLGREHLVQQPDLAVNPGLGLLVN